MAIKKGDTVKVHYTGTFDDGKVFDSSEGKEPLQFAAGQGQVVKGFDEAVVGMKQGEEKEIHVTPENAYGDRNDQLVQQVPKDNVPPDVKEGMVLGVKTPDGKQFPATVTEVGEQITLDLNHPLAGKNLNFKIKIEEITPA